MFPCDFFWPRIKRWRAPGSVEGPAGRVGTSAQLDVVAARKVDVDVVVVADGADLGEHRGAAFVDHGISLMKPLPREPSFATEEEVLGPAFTASAGMLRRAQRSALVSAGLLADHGLLRLGPSARSLGLVIRVAVAGHVGAAKRGRSIVSSASSCAPTQRAGAARWWRLRWRLRRALAERGARPPRGVPWPADAVLAAAKSLAPQEGLAGETWLQRCAKVRRGDAMSLRWALAVLGKLRLRRCDIRAAAMAAPVGP
mmetsp:Transcript_4378/g.16554  ORF Transcript_4378/g.16554 Transcript_4378/m.16554 type:complete len:256 (+) Transcript_4378:64-831(+)